MEEICRHQFTVNGRSFAVVVKFDMAAVREKLDVDSDNSAQNAVYELNDQQLDYTLIEMAR